MTREKAIEEIKNYENYPNGLSKECRDYIIKVLEQKPKIKFLSAAEAIQKIAYKTPHITYAFQEDLEYMEVAGFRICEVEK